MNPDIRNLLEPGKSVLWVASAGGHLAELKKIAELNPYNRNASLWVTFDTAQARSMLDGEPVVYVDYIAPRDIKNTIKALPSAYRVLSEGKFDYVVSTGAALAVTFLPLSIPFKAKTVYVESLTRTHGPSTTGKILQFFPGIRKFTQYPSWAGRKWTYGGSILDCWRSVKKDAPSPVTSILVSLGSIRPFRFDRAVETVRGMLTGREQVTWQLGATSREDLPGQAYESMDWQQLGSTIGTSDVFVCHAGVGSVLQALEHGKIPLLAVRSARHKEHVDDHQSAFADEIVRRGLGIRLPVGGRSAPTFDVVAGLMPERY